MVGRATSYSERVNKGVRLTPRQWQTLAEASEALGKSQTWIIGYWADALARAMSAVREGGETGVAGAELLQKATRAALAPELTGLNIRQIKQQLGNLLDSLDEMEAHLEAADIGGTRPDATATKGEPSAGRPAAA